MKQQQADAVVIGAGVVGLACARELALAGKQTLLLESESQVGSQLSSHNSEVIHAGLYYPPASLKARYCLRGKQLLYAYCQQKGISHRRCGKLILANPAQEAELRSLHDNALASGAAGLSWVTKEALAREEPWLSAHMALHSADSGIIDSHALMQSLEIDATDAGALLCRRHRVSSIDCQPHNHRLEITAPDGHFTLRATHVINAAGLEAVPLLRHIQGYPNELLPQQRYARGNYFRLHGKSPSQRLVYPLPEAHGLGIHLTIDLAGAARFGPDVEWVEEADWRVNAERKAAFVSAIRRYWPDLPTQKLQPDYAGLRPKLWRQGQPLTDFVIEDEQQHGIAGLINLLAIESPGLTASMALAELVK